MGKKKHAATPKTKGTPRLAVPQLSCPEPPSRLIEDPKAKPFFYNFRKLLVQVLRQVVLLLCVIEQSTDLRLHTASLARSTYKTLLHVQSQGLFCALIMVMDAPTTA